MFYPSWIEIPVHNLERAVLFYRGVFNLSEVPSYDLDEEGMPMRVIVLLTSDKSVKGPGVSLVQSTRHKPSVDGLQVNFHVGDHATIDRVLGAVSRFGGEIVKPVIDMGDGVRYAVIRDSESNTVAVSSYEERA